MTNTTTDTQETTATTLTGEELPPEEDPYTPPEDEPDRKDNSIYPIETPFRVQAAFDDSGGRNPFYFTIAIEIPYDVDTIPSSRTQNARKTISRKINWDAPELGTLGTITFTEDDHRVKLYPENERDTKTPGEWMLEQFHYMLEEASAEYFSSSNIPISAVTELQDLVHQHLPGTFITVGGECRQCGSEVEAQTYVSDPEADSGFAWCDCGTGTSYPKKDS